MRTNAARFGSFWLAALCVLLSAGFARERQARAGADEAKGGEPWSAAETVSAEDLHRELTSKYGQRPEIVYVGFRTLFAGGHIPGATFHGTASKPEGLEELRNWASSQPRTASVVLYCGCCPFERCPNVRPAYAALHAMGFRKVRVLILPTSFAADWAGKGYAIEKGM